MRRAPVGALGRMGQAPLPAVPNSQGTYQRNGPRRKGQWEGYGIQPMGPGCPPAPTDALEECIRAFTQIFEDVLQITDLAPWIHPPFRSRFVCEHRRVVLSTTAALNAATNAAGIALAAAQNTVVAGFVPLLEMTGAGDFQTIFTLNVPRSHAARVKSWGITVVNGAPQALTVNIRAGTTAGPPGPPNAFISGAEVSEHQPTFFLMQAGQQLLVQGILANLLSPLLIDFGICYWFFPVTKRVDDRSGTRLRSGYGLDC